MSRTLSCLRIAMMNNKLQICARAAKAASQTRDPHGSETHQKRPGMEVLRQSTHHIVPFQFKVSLLFPDIGTFDFAVLITLSTIANVSVVTSVPTLLMAMTTVVLATPMEDPGI
jgi:hypothetical protein